MRVLSRDTGVNFEASVRIEARSKPKGVWDTIILTTDGQLSGQQISTS